MSDLSQCDPEIFRDGLPLLAADTSDCCATGFEPWVKTLAILSGQRIDWHYSGGVAQVLYIGDRTKIMEAAKDLECPAQVLRWFKPGEPGLYRSGVTPMPPGAIAAWYEGGPGSTFA